MRYHDLRGKPQKQRAAICYSLWGEKASCPCCQGKAYLTKGSYFAECERDEEGRCKPSGQGGSSKPAEKPGKPEAKPSKPRGPRAAHRSKRPQVDEVVSHVAKVKDNPSPEHVRQLADTLSKMTVKDIHEVKKKLGLKASGNKLELAQKVAERALAAAGKEPKPPKLGHITEAARPQLTEEEDSALEHYMASAWINDELRGQPLRPEATQYFSDERRDEVRRDLASTFAKIKPMPAPVEVHRGLYFQDEEQKKKFLAGLQQDAVVTWPGYTSTSPSLDAAKGYMDDHKVRLKINAVEGLDLTHYGYGDSGGEFVLPHNSRLVVTGVENEDGETVITLDQLRGHE